MDHENLIEVSHLSRYYAGRRSQQQETAAQPHQSDWLSAYTIAVDDISFTLKRGEILGFLGPNGAGKSTTMQMLTGNLSPTHGQIKIAGIDLMDNPIDAKARIGYLPDTPPLYKDLSVDEYLGYCARLNRIPRARIKQAIDQSKERCGLTEHGKRIINNLSKGYQQRVGIAQAIIHSPDVVIMDEPTVGLDPIQMVEIRKLIKELGETHSVMLSSHILPEIQTICNNVQIINQGRLIFNASIETLNQQMQTPTLAMYCSRAIKIEKLQALAGISKVDQQGEKYLIQCAGQGQDEAIKLSQQLIEMAAQNQWGLYEIYREKYSLEDVFMSLTRFDPTDSAAPEQEVTA
jgi:ABC-2 type transport system ATP-binding protein